MKKKCIIIWCSFVVCVIATVILRFFVDAQEVEYEEVEVKVLSANTERGYDYQTHSSYEKHEVMVEYNGESFQLENVYDTYSYQEGRTTKAYLSKGRLFANVEGVASSTPLAIAYFVFLFGSFILFIIGFVSIGGVIQEKNRAKAG